MLTETTNHFDAPAGFAAWLACAAFALWFFLLADKAVQRLRGKPPQPSNRQLDDAREELDRRVTALEEWKNDLLQKLDDDKTEILAAGGRREEKLSAEIAALASRVDGMHTALANLPGEFMTLLANAKNILGQGGEK